MRRSWLIPFLLLLLAHALGAQPRLLDPQLQIRRVLSLPRNTIAIARNPADGRLWLANANGDLGWVDPDALSPALEVVYRSADHQVTRVAAFAIGPDGTFYLTENRPKGRYTIAVLIKGVSEGDAGGRRWAALARTEPYPLCGNNFDHQANGIAVSPDNRYVFLNSGSRTDHGEVQSNQGAFPGLREVPLTSAIFRLPANGEELVLPAGENALTASGYLFADGLRNAYDLAFDAEDRLFATENGPDRDMDDELNWIREGHHYGFPWRMGAEDNPQQFPSYAPATDRLLPASFVAVTRGTYANDPTFPPPAGPFTDPVRNLGPDADSFRDPADGRVKDASELGLARSTFTSHRSPLGLVFDATRRLGPPYTGGALVMGWTEGDPIGQSRAGPFRDPGQDLLFVDLHPRGEGFDARVVRIADRFANPVDAALQGNRLFVVEFGGGRGLWEVTFPESPTAVAEAPGLPAAFALAQNYPNPFNGGTQIQYSLDRAGSAELAVFDLAGQRLRTLAAGELPDGAATLFWDGRDQQGWPVASGVYLYRLRAGGQNLMRRLALVR